MIKVVVKSKIFIKIWLWSLLWGIVFGLGLGLLVGKLLGLFNVPNGGDNMAQGLYLSILILSIGSLSSYIIAIVLGSRIVRRREQNVRIYLAKTLPLCIIAFLLSMSILFPLVLFASVIAAFIVTLSISKVVPESGVLTSKPSNAPIIDKPTKT